MTISRLALASATVAIGVALAGCSAATENASPATSQEAPAPVTSASPAASIAQAADSTTPAGSARIISTTTVAGSQDLGTEGQDTPIPPAGVVNSAENAADLRVSAPLPGPTSSTRAPSRRPAWAIKYSSSRGLKRKCWPRRRRGASPRRRRRAPSPVPSGRARRRADPMPPPAARPPGLTPRPGPSARDARSP